MSISKTIRICSLFLIFCLIMISISKAQNTTPPPPSGRAALLKANEGKLVYPLFKGSTSTGVMPVENTSMPYGFKGQCKLVFDLGVPVKDPGKGNVHYGIEEIMRIINLHVAAGVPKEKIDAVVIFYGPATASFMNDENYNKLYQISNPNKPLIQQLKDKGVKMVVCGQTVALRSLEMSAFPSGIMKSFSAITSLSDMQHKGYVLYTIAAE